MEFEQRRLTTTFIAFSYFGEKMLAKAHVCAHCGLCEFEVVLGLDFDLDL